MEVVQAFPRRRSLCGSCPAACTNRPEKSSQAAGCTSAISRWQQLSCRVRYRQTEKSFSILSSRFSLGSPDSSTLSSLVSQPCSAWPNPPQSIQACLIHFAKMLLGSPSRWATAVQLGPSVRQSSTASRFCRAVQRSRVLVGLVIDEQSEGHGVTSIDLSTKPGQPH